MKKAGLFAVLLALVCCSSSESASPTVPPVVDPPAEVDASTDPPDGAVADAAVDARDARPDGPPPVPGNLRVVAANISSGPSLVYGPAEGVRIFQGLRPDVVLIQELVVGGNSTTEVDAYVTTTFGATFSYYREPGAQIPNGIISRYPILESGTWVDPQVANRGFAYAKLDLPGGHPLWAISLHLLTSGVAQRAAEVTSLVAQVKATIPAADYLVLGGDFNTGSRVEPCIVDPLTGLAQIVVTAAPYPADGAGNDNTSGPRSKPHDWLLADTDLAAFSVPVAIGQRGYPGGLVFDSRVFMPLADVAPVQMTDSAATNMQHMPVVRDFLVPE
ncbi:MAG TPA: endonuclease/exonuclease/phosphatase family protein [Labilithrix sp.]|nr:endonuclease/exonuclease/phosphatase family protein [Labilithrix sp.]